MARRKKDFKTMHPYLKYWELMKLEYKMAEAINSMVALNKSVKEEYPEFNLFNNILRCMRSQQRAMKEIKDLCYADYGIGEDYLDWMQEYGKTGKIPEQIK